MEIAAIERELIGLVQKWTTSREPVTARSTFYQDLSVVGDDFCEILVEITKRHGTSFEGFRFDKYVPNEATALWYFWAMRLGFCRNRFSPLTIRHMAAVVAHGKWFEP
jgi:hypothetical protein